ncbi:MAG: ATP-binding protein [Acidimicrobiia bacterium]
MFQTPRVSAATEARVRYSGCLVAAAAMLVFPDVPGRLRWGLLGTLVVYAVCSQTVSALRHRLSNDVSMLLQALLGIACLASATVFAGPYAEIAMIAYPCMPLFFTFLSDRWLGTFTAVLVALVAFVLMLISDDISPLAFAAVLSAEGATLLVSTYMVSERTDVTNRLERLRDALRQVSQAPALEPTLESITTAIEQTVRTARACILLRATDHLRIAAPEALRAQHSDQITEVVSARELNEPDSSMRRVMARGRARTEVVFPREGSAAWVGELLGNDFASAAVVALVPLNVAGTPIGILVVSAESGNELDDDEVEVLEIYAEQAAIVIVRAQAYEESQRAAFERERADQLKSEFLALVSHELRSPLTSVKGWISTVRRHWDRFDDDRRLELLARAESNADELTRLIDQLLDFSRIEDDRFDLSLETFLLNDLMVEVRRDLHPSLEGRSVIVDFPTGLAVYADRHAVRHVLVNLLSNAIKYSGDGAAVSVRGEQHGAWVTVTVIDHGVGIAGADLHRIFERFVQLDGSPHRARRGTGIGLAIARRFTEAHGGEIWAASEVGVGSSFSFTVPGAGSEEVSVPMVSE